jgi:putative copper export protein
VTFAVVARHLTDDDLQRALRRVGLLASWSVGVLVATGTAQSLRLHGGVPSGRHGAILLAKLAVVAGMLVLASLVRRSLRSGVASNRGALHRLAFAEIGTGATVLALSAALVLTSPT